LTGNGSALQQAWKRISYRDALPSPMRNGLINGSGSFESQSAGSAWERVVPSFHSITKLKIFIAGSVQAGT
jgi:hypothetical protein